ncbi:MAG: hypothetical protein DRJ50_00230 [Actinobacteria bacterium]|nr:MAG: hypothetical protein DRJ50_00230 [Actinomycetota bacterium]
MHRTSGRILLLVAAFALFLVPAAAIAAGGFTDVEDDSLFVADIQWMKDTGVTAGCNPPTNDKFCPKNNVTREQMSAFMHRLAVNQIVDAATAIEADNADTLDGMDSTAFAGSGHNHDADYLAIDGKAADADELDGKDAAEILSTAASVGVTALSVNPNFAPLLSITGFEAPADGGALLVNASVFASRNTADQHGTLWLEIDRPGACESSGFVPGSGMYLVTALRSIQSVSVTGAAEVPAGTHRINLCHEGNYVTTSKLTALMTVQWVPVVDAVGIQSTEGVSTSELLAEVAAQLDL